MPTYFVDSAVAGPGTGTEADPFKSTASLNLANGDTAYIAGEQPTISLTSKLFVRLRQWAGRSRWRPTPRVRIANGSWTLDTGSRYKFTLASAPSILAYRYAESVNANGDYFGVMRKVANRAAVVAPGQWAHESGVLYAIPPAQAGGATPDQAGESLAYAYVPSSGAAGANSCVKLSACAACVVSGAQALLGLNAGNDDAGFWLDSCVQTTISGCEAHDCGRHGFEGIGSANTDNVFEDCYSSGGWDAQGGWSAFVHYAAADVTGAQCIRCVGVMRHTLGPDGATEATKAVDNGQASQAPQAFLAHTDNAAHFASINWRECDAVGRAGVRHGTPFVNSNPMSVAANDRYDWRKYTTRAVLCRAINCNAWGQLARDIAFVWCSFDLRRAKDFLGPTGSGGRCVFWSNSEVGPTQRYTLMQSSEIVADFSGATFAGSDSVGLFAPELYNYGAGQVQDFHELILRGVTCHVVGTDYPNAHAFIRTGDVHRSPYNSQKRCIDAERCVFSSEAPFNLLACDGMSPEFAQYGARLYNNWYSGVAAYTYANPSTATTLAYDTETEFKTAPFGDGDGAGGWSGSGVYGVATMFRAPAQGDLRPSIDSALNSRMWRAGYAVGPPTVDGLAGAPDVGAYGARQPSSAFAGADGAAPGTGDPRPRAFGWPADRPVGSGNPA